MFYRYPINSWLPYRAVLYIIQYISPSDPSIHHVSPKTFTIYTSTDSKKKLKAPTQVIARSTVYVLYHIWQLQILFTVTPVDQSKLFSTYTPIAWQVCHLFDPRVSSLLFLNARSSRSHPMVLRFFSPSFRVHYNSIIIGDIQKSVTFHTGLATVVTLFEMEFRLINPHSSIGFSSVSINDDNLIVPSISTTVQVWNFHTVALKFQLRLCRFAIWLP